jgi:hypothetical protein
VSTILEFDWNKQVYSRVSLPERLEPWEQMLQRIDNRLGKLQAATL